MAKEKSAEKRKFVDRATFMKACYESKSNAEVAEKTGLKIMSVVQRRTKLRNMGIPLPAYDRVGGGNRINLDTELQSLSKLIGVDVAVLKAQSKAQLEAKNAKA